MSSRKKDASEEDEEYFQPISPSLVHHWRKIRSNYQKNIGEEAKAKAKRAEDLARIQKMKESLQNRRGRESRIKLVDEDDEEEERPAKRRKIADDDGNNQNITIEEPINDDLPLEVISMVFDHLDLTELYRHCILVSKSWNSLAPTKIAKSFERLSNELKEHTKVYPNYMKCQDYFTRITKLMPRYNNILPLVYHRIRQTLATKKDKRELFTISVEHAEEEIGRKDRHLFSFERTGYVIKDQTVDDEIMPIGCSKLGGVPDLPPSIEWPATDGQSHRFFAQIRLDELSLFDVCGLLPWTTGMLYFFEDEKVIHYDGDAHSLIQKKNCLHVLGYPEFDFETMPFESQEEKGIDQDDDGFQPEVPSTMLFGTISSDTFDSISSRTYSWTLEYDKLASGNTSGIHFELGGD